LKAMTRESGLQGELAHLSFEIAPPKRGRQTSPQRRVHVVKGRRVIREAGTSVVRVVALVATEEDGQLIHVRRLHSR
jgi:hypothetical protein